MLYMYLIVKHLWIDFLSCSEVVKNSSAHYHSNNSPAQTSCCHGCGNDCLPQPSSGPVEFLQSSSCSLNFYKRKTNIQLIYIHSRLIPVLVFALLHGSFNNDDYLLRGVNRGMQIRRFLYFLFKAFVRLPNYNHIQKQKCKGSKVNWYM